ncbi:MAG: hypothetical protein IJH18_00060 [Bacilli bacterium]|nr:hypothetical protein [Bacilli bacterium]
MRKGIKILSSLLLVVAVLTLVGCAAKREDLKFNDTKGSLVFSVKEDGNYKISKNPKDLRNTREQGVLIGKDFKISIEFDDSFGYFFDGDFNKLKEKRRNDYDDFKEVTYSDMKGIQYFYSGYMCYNVIFPIEGNKDYTLVLSVYGAEDNEKAAKEAIKNEEVLDVLNHISNVKVKK